MPKAHHLHIYESGRHLAVTLIFVVLPFAFFLLFSQIAKISFTQLFADLAFSFSRIVVAYFIAVLLGWIFAVLFSRGKMASIGLPIFDVLQSLPTFAALPLAVFFWGPSNVTVVVFLVLAIVWPVFFSVVSSLKLVQHDWEEAAEMFGLRGFAYARHFLLPVSMPGLITGSIVGLGDGWEALIATEIIVRIPKGLGNFFQLFAHNPSITVFGILAFLVFIFSINKLVWLRLLEWSHRKMEE